MARQSQRRPFIRHLWIRAWCRSDSSTRLPLISYFVSRKTPRQILKGPCKWLAWSMCAMGHSHTRFIHLVVLIMCALYLLWKARSAGACNKAPFSHNKSARTGLFRLELWLQIDFFNCFNFSFTQFSVIPLKRFFHFLQHILPTYIPVFELHHIYLQLS